MKNLTVKCGNISISNSNKFFSRKFSNGNFSLKKNVITSGLKWKNYTTGWCSGGGKSSVFKTSLIPKMRKLDVLAETLE